MPARLQSLDTHQRGAALVVGLLLLTVLTLLAISGMTAALLELQMAGNEQYRERAFRAADAGIERAIRAGAYDTGTPIGTYLPPSRPGFPPTPQRGSGVRGCVRTIDEDGSAIDTEDCYEYFMRYDEHTGPTAVPDPSFDPESGLQAWHFVIDAYGSSARGAVSHHTQGFYVVSADPPGPSPDCTATPDLCEAGVTHDPVRTYWRQGGS
jgi:type IV pilus assembly protein PilX